MGVEPQLHLEYVLSKSRFCILILAQSCCIHRYVIYLSCGLFFIIEIVQTVSNKGFFLINKQNHQEVTVQKTNNKETKEEATERSGWKASLLCPNPWFWEPQSTILITFWPVLKSSGPVDPWSGLHVQWTKCTYVELLCDEMRGKVLWLPSVGVSTLSASGLSPKLPSKSYCISKKTRTNNH